MLVEPRVVVIKDEPEDLRVTMAEVVIAEEEAEDAEEAPEAPAPPTYFNQPLFKPENQLFLHQRLWSSQQWLGW